MVFDKVKASVGIGSATVDTRLDQAEFQPGDYFSAQVHVQGGDTDQKIEGLELKLMVEMREEEHEAAQTKVLDTWHIHDYFTIHEGEKQVLDFDGYLHYETPITQANFPRNLTKVWIQTGADVDNAVDPKDKDYLRIKPTPAMRAMMDAVEECGWRPDRLTVDDDRIKVGGKRADLNCDQEFCYLPPGSSGGQRRSSSRSGEGGRSGGPRSTSRSGEGGRSSSRRSSSTNYSAFEEIEVHFVPREHETHVLLEFDFHNRSEEFRSMTIDHDNYTVDSLADEFQRHVDRMA